MGSWAWLIQRIQFFIQVSTWDVEPKIGGFDPQNGTCLSSLGLKPPKEGTFHSKQGAPFGFQVYKYIIWVFPKILIPQNGW